MQLPNGKYLIVFDGYCYLCNWVVRVVIKFDKKESFLFTPMHSEKAINFREKHKIPEEINSVILIKNDHFYIRSGAVLAIAQELGGLFYPFLIGWIIPRLIRDRLYDRLAKNRFHWFVKRDQCAVPPDTVKHRFI